MFILKKGNVRATAPKSCFGGRDVDAFGQSTRRQKTSSYLYQKFFPDRIPLTGMMKSRKNFCREKFCPVHLGVEK
jgi:hypothetical protein